jgi:FKBP-type peptidyl-prolyl cis-trans isomerase SlyD|tara:strand:- start:1979 stop:2425 length:447 start_codon:yes stop_codon:yes gene_type:complete
VKITSNSIVAIDYTLSNNKSGEVLEKTPDDQVMKFKFGIGELLPLFESNIIGLIKGDDFDFIIPPKDAYGPLDAYAVFDLPMDTFTEDGNINSDMMQVGNKIPLTDKHGNKHMGIIKVIMKDAVTMDFNHPLAGIELRFVGSVTDVIE